MDGVSLFNSEFTAQLEMLAVCLERRFLWWEVLTTKFISKSLLYFGK